MVGEGTAPAPAPASVDAAPMQLTLGPLRARGSAGPSHRTSCHPARQAASLLRGGKRWGTVRWLSKGQSGVSRPLGRGSSSPQLLTAGPGPPEASSEPYFLPSPDRPPGPTNYIHLFVLLPRLTTHVQSGLDSHLQPWLPLSILFPCSASPHS